MPREPEINAVLVCDDIREEITHKLTLIGVYSGDLVVPEFPSNFPLAFYVAMTANEPGEFALDLRISPPEAPDLRTIHVEFGVTAGADTPTIGKAFAIFTPKIPIVVPAPGELVLSARWGKREKFRPVLRKKVILAPPAT